MPPRLARPTAQRLKYRRVIEIAAAAVLDERVVRCMPTDSYGFLLPSKSHVADHIDAGMLTTGTITP